MNKKIYIALVVLLASCGPITSSSYEFIPPQTYEGQMCVNNCLGLKNSCQQMCDIKDASCDFIKYVGEGNSKHELASYMHESRYCSDNFCDNDCDSDFRLCYANCGGQVIENKSCVMFCPKY